MKIPFEKWHGCQNDFIVVWLRSSDIGTIDESLRRRASHLCSKKGDGIGADGILVLEVGKEEEYVPKQLIIINSDGSLAQNCGNGLRCAAGSILQKALTVLEKDLQSADIKVFDQEFLCQFLITKKNRLFPYISVSMPQTKIDGANSWFPGIVNNSRDVLNQHQIKFEKVHGVEIFNRHLVVFLDRDFDQKDKLLNCAKNFQQFFNGDGINVHFVRALAESRTQRDEAELVTGGNLAESYEVFVYERGAGVTQACGSGALAIASISIQSGFIDQGEIIGLKMPGGWLYVAKDDGDNLKLVGPAVKVFSGEFDL